MWSFRTCSCIIVFANATMFLKDMLSNNFLTMFTVNLTILSGRNCVCVLIIPHQKCFTTTFSRLGSDRSVKHTYSLMKQEFTLQFALLSGQRSLYKRHLIICTCPMLTPIYISLSERDGVVKQTPKYYGWSCVLVGEVQVIYVHDHVEVFWGVNRAIITLWHIPMANAKGDGWTLVLIFRGPSLWFRQSCTAAL